MGIPQPPKHQPSNVDELHHNDKVIIVTGNPYTKVIRKQVWSFHNLRRASPERQNRVDEFQRYLEALKGQGIETHVVSILDWWRFANAFPAYFHKKWSI